LIFTTTAKAIEKINNVIQSPDFGNNEYKKEILNYLHRITELVLEVNNVTCGNISTNIMELIDGKLQIIEFDLETTDRVKKVDLSIDPSQNKPGAPKAYNTKEVTYISDTDARDVKEHFIGKPYKCILSIPVIDQDKDVIAIINIDSSLKNQFKNIDFYYSKMESVITPLLSLIKLERMITDTKVRRRR
jgi:hypothetical protein